MGASRAVGMPGMASQRREPRDDPGRMQMMQSVLRQQQQRPQQRPPEQQRFVGLEQRRTVVGDDWMGG